jgi:hypothetical protein
MEKLCILLCFAFVVINECFTRTNEELYIENNLRSLKPTPILDSKTKNADSLKLHSKLLQTLYSDSYSNNYYYTTLYIGPNKIKQTYLIDTTNAIFSSPCGACEECGKHKKNYYDHSNKKAYKPLKCSSKICKLVPASGCNISKDDKKKKKLDQLTCSFYSKKSNGNGLKGNYLSNIVYFEEDKILKSNKKVYRSYALPIGCTTGEFGKFKSYKSDGVMGLNNDKGSFINVLKHLNIVNKNLFSLCFGLEGGYMSLGEIDKTYHYSKKINYVPLLTSNNLYSFNVHGYQVGQKKKEKYKVVAYIDTTTPFSYFPNKMFKTIYKQITELCKDKKGKNICGKFQYDSQLGYCVSYTSRESLFKSVNRLWPNITLLLQNGTEFLVKGINYHYYYFNDNSRKACLGFKSTDKEFISIGTNFLHGKDIIFNKDHQKLGFVNADCRARNTYVKNILNAKKTKSKSNDDEAIDEEIHKNEKKGKYNLGDDNNKDSVVFVQGHNTELDDNQDFNFFNFTVLLTSILIVVIVILVVVIALMCKKKEFPLYENISDEPNDFQVPRKIEEDNSPNEEKITSEEVQFLRKIMKITNK